MGVARTKNGVVKSVVTRDRDGNVLERYESGIIIPGKAGPAPEPLPEPTVLDMADHLGGALVKWAARGFPIADRGLRIHRLGLCRQCVHWREDARAGLGKCAHPSCGCTKAKVFLKTEKCPIGRW